MVSWGTSRAYCGTPLQARLCHLEVWGGSAEREASSRRAGRMGALVAPDPDAPAKKKGQPHAELAGTGPELCGREEAR